MTIDDIKKLEHKTPIATPIVAEVVEAYDRKGPIGKFSKYVQRVKLAQGNSWIYTEFENQNDIAPFKGKEITITPSQDREGNPTGIYAHKTEHNGNNYDNLRVTKSAKITAGPSEGFPSGTSAPASTPAQSDSASRQSAQPKGQTQTDLMRVRKILNQQANLLVHCYGAARYMRDAVKKEHSVEISDEAFEQKVSCMFIEANKKGLSGLTPAGTIGAPNAKVSEPEPQPEPEQEEEDLDDVPF